MNLQQMLDTPLRLSREETQDLFDNHPRDYMLCKWGTEPLFVECNDDELRTVILFWESAEGGLPGSSGKDVLQRHYRVLKDAEAWAKLNSVDLETRSRLGIRFCARQAYGPMEWLASPNFKR